jgi:hypothetical protein
MKASCSEGSTLRDRAGACAHDAHFAGDARLRPVDPPRELDLLRAWVELSRARTGHPRNTARRSSRADPPPARPGGASTSAERSMARRAELGDRRSARADALTDSTNWCVAPANLRRWHQSGPALRAAQPHALSYPGHPLRSGTKPPSALARAPFARPRGPLQDQAGGDPHRPLAGARVRSSSPASCSRAIDRWAPAPDCCPARSHALQEDQAQRRRARASPGIRNEDPADARPRRGALGRGREESGADGPVRRPDFRAGGARPARATCPARPACPAATAARAGVSARARTALAAAAPGGPRRRPW